VTGKNFEKKREKNSPQAMRVVKHIHKSRFARESTNETRSRWKNAQPPGKRKITAHLALEEI